MRTVKAYKLARPNGWDFYTGRTINYRRGIGGIVKCPNPDPRLGVCSRGVIHASKKPNDCFVGVVGIPCSAYRVEGKPVCGNAKKWGFLELKVLEEIKDLDALFGWRYSEVVNLINPLQGKAKKPTSEDIKLLDRMAFITANISGDVWTSVRDSIVASVAAKIEDSVTDSIWGVVNSIRGSTVYNTGISSIICGYSIWDSVWAYIGSLFPNIKKWKYVKHARGEYPFQPAVDLWKRGFVISSDIKLWRLHSGKNAKIVYEKAK